MMASNYGTHDALARTAVIAALRSAEILPASSSTMSTPFSAIINRDACKFPLTTEGMTEASIICNASMP
jgi:hypothetical protein